MPIPPLLLLGAAGLGAGLIVAGLLAPKKTETADAPPKVPTEKKKPLPPPEHTVDEIDPPGTKGKRKPIELKLPKDPSTQDDAPEDPPTNEDPPDDDAPEDPPTNDDAGTGGENGK